MADLKLVRVRATLLATFGVLMEADSAAAPFAVTLEREFDGGSNRPSTTTRAGACIPAGTYSCVRVLSPKFKDTFLVRGVDGRSEILFHKGNLQDDSRGCVLVGEQFNPVKDGRGITASAEGFEEFMRLQAGVTSFTLTIVNAF